MSKKSDPKHTFQTSLNADNAVQLDKGIKQVRDSVSHNWHNLDNRLSMIAEAAYFKAKNRGFVVGREVEDWLQAEQELAEIMGSAQTPL